MSVKRVFVVRPGQFYTEPGATDPYQYGDFIAYDPATQASLITAAEAASASGKLTDLSVVPDVSAIGPLAGVASLNGGPLGGRRNMVINGDFSVDQRGESFTNPANVHTFDLWRANTTGVVQRVADGPDARTPTCLEVTGSSTANMQIDHKIEGAIARRAAGRQVTFSADMKSVAGAGQAALVMQTANALDNFSAATALLYSTRTLTAGWVRYSATLTLPADAANGVEVRIDRLHADTAHTTRIANVQLEIGGEATPFEPVNPALEQLRCWRYFFRHGAFGNTFQNFGSAVAISSTLILLPNPNSVEMRAAPSLASSGTFRAFGMTDSAASSSITGELNARGGSILYNGTGFTRGAYYIRAENDGAAYFDLSAEL